MRNEPNLPPCALGPAGSSAQTKPIAGYAGWDPSSSRLCKTKPIPAGRGAAGGPGFPSRPPGLAANCAKQTQFPAAGKRRQVLCGRGVMVNRTVYGPRQNKANCPAVPGGTRPVGRGRGVLYKQSQSARQCRAGRGLGDGGRGANAPNKPNSRRAQQRPCRFPPSPLAPPAFDPPLAGCTNKPNFRQGRARQAWVRGAAVVQTSLAMPQACAKQTQFSGTCRAKQSQFRAVAAVASPHCSSIPQFRHFRPMPGAPVMYPGWAVHDRSGDPRGSDAVAQARGEGILPTCSFVSRAQAPIESWAGCPRHARARRPRHEAARVMHPICVLA